MDNSASRKIERITSLITPPVVGRFYLVPTVEFPWLHKATAGPWPVFMSKHEDGEHLNFPHEHYHVDPRFLTAGEFGRAGSYTHRTDAFGTCQAYPLQRTDFVGGVRSNHPHPAVVWRRKRCARADLPYRWGREIAMRLGPAFHGRQCKKARTGWVCPHKHVALGSVAPVDGIITCPLHGLQINAETGVVVGPCSSARPSTSPLEIANG